MAAEVDLRDKHVFVTGATGFLGSHLVMHLTTLGARITALTRRPERDRYIRDLPNITIVQGDVTKLATMQSLITPDVDYVFHVAAVLSGSLDHQRKVNVVGTENVVRASANANVKRLIHISTIAVYGYGHQTDITETSSFTSSGDPYVISKQEAEARLIQVASETNLQSYSIIRPGMIYGPRAPMWTKNVMRLASITPTPWLGKGDGLCYPIYVDDVINQMLLQAVLPEAHNDVFNATPDPSPTWREYIGEYQKLTGKTRWLSLPYRILYGLVKLAVTPAALLRGQDFFLLELLRYTQSTVTYRMDKARDRLRWQPQVGLAEGVQKCVPYLREKGFLN